MANLDIALQKVLGWEGGFSNNPHDSGGATFRGVTIGTYMQYCKLKGKTTPSVEDLKKLDYRTIRDLADVLYFNTITSFSIFDYFIVCTNFSTINTTIRHKVCTFVSFNT